MFFSSKTDGDSPERFGKLRLILILAGAAAGILLLTLGGNLFDTSEEEPEAAVTISAQEELELYQEYLEKRVKALCESVDGVSNVTVAVTLSGNFVEIYATESVDGNEEYVIVGSGSNASALHLSQQAPEIAGIGVVCHGGGNSDIRRELTFLLCAAFEVSGNRIYITEAKS